MEDHSVRGYLRRRSTKELENMLALYLEGKNYQKYDYAIREILLILKESSIKNPPRPRITSQQ